MHRLRLSGHVAVAALAAVVVVACEDPPSGSVVITTGEETDVFSRAPTPSTVIAEEIGVDASRHELARTALPADTLDIGDHGRSDVGGIGVSAIDATGKVIIKGESLFAQWGALQDSPLEVFVQRTGELARMPAPPGPFDAKAVTIATGRYILAADGTSTLLYDLLGLRVSVSAPTLPRAAKSVIVFDSVVAAIDETGASTYDLASASTGELVAPVGGTFAEVAGGQTILGGDGAAYVVGATRFGTPTARIYIIDVNGKATFASLTTPREGACATWVTGRGLVVVGGAPTGSGAEILISGGTQATPIPLPADPVHGCAAAALDVSHVLVAGGTATTAPSRVLDLACAGNCVPASWPSTVALARTDAVALAADAALVTGDDGSGATHAYRVSATAIAELPLRVPRRGARLVQLPSGLAAALVGGGAEGIEQYRE